MHFSERICCNINEAAAATGVSRSKLYLLMDEGKIEYTTAAGRRRILVQSLLAFLAPAKAVA